MLPMLFVTMLGWPCWNMELCHSHEHDKKGTPKGANVLTRAENTTIRLIVYNGGWGISAGSPTDLGRRVTVNQKIVTLHRMKRIGTLKLLLDVVKGGRPQDARAAATIAEALEAGPVAALCLVDAWSDELDTSQGANQPTLREGLIARLEAMVRRAEKQIPAIK